jgi:8-oxo-dGTP pyrophosphatase MutT (NUDIX family)
MGFLSKIKASDDDEIGTGDHALTTDKSGKFWGNAGAGGVFYCKSTKKFLLAFRSAHVNEPHTWGVWGGAIDDDESPLQAVKREVQEETGYKGNYQIIPSFVYKKGDFQYHNFVIVVEKEFDPKLDWETEKFGWFALDEFPTPLHFGLKSLVSHLKDAVRTFKSKVNAYYSIQADYKKYLGTTWVHHSDHTELKFNYKKFHQDPIGIYFFPEQFRTGGSWHVKPYKFTAKLKPEAKVLDISLVKTVEDVKNLFKELDYEPDNPEYYKDLETAGKPSKWAWGHLQEKFQGRAGAFTKKFLDAGYDAIFDDSDTIFSGEDQLIVLKPKMLANIKRIDLTATGYKEISKAREVILEILKNYDGKVIQAKKPAKKTGWGNDPAYIQSTIIFNQENGGREVVFTIQTNTHSMGGKRRPATEIELSAIGSSDAFKKHLGSYYNNDSHRPRSLQWRLEEFDSTKIKPWLEKAMKMLWDDEEPLRKKTRQEESTRKYEEQRKKSENLQEWFKTTLPLSQKKDTPQDYKNLMNDIRISIENEDKEKATDLVKGLQKWIDGVDDSLKGKIALEQSHLAEKLKELN